MRQTFLLASHRSEKSNLDFSPTIGVIIFVDFCDNFDIFHMHSALKRPRSYVEHTQDHEKCIYLTWGGSQTVFGPKEDVPKVTYPQNPKIRSPKSDAQG